MFKNQKVSIDLRIVCAVLLLVIAALIVLWRPWTLRSGEARTITLTGEATMKAEPDEFQFNPTYQKKGTDRAAIQQELIAQVNNVIEKLKELGVQESDISLSSSTYDNYWNDGTSEVTSNTLTITVGNKELSQKVQDYLVTTSPQGQVSPYATFSSSKRKELETKVRADAIADAKNKADAMAADLEVKLGKVVSITDQQPGGVMPMLGRDMAVAETSSSLSLPVLAGEQEISYSVQIIYELR